MGRKIHLQCVKPAESHTIKPRPVKGVDVFLTIDGGLRSVRGVCENTVRCLLGRDYEYFARRNVNHDGCDMSRPITESDLRDLQKSRA